jgi:hypothetical protein
MTVHFKIETVHDSIAGARTCSESDAVSVVPPSPVGIGSPMPHDPTTPAASAPLLIGSLERRLNIGWWALYLHLLKIFHPWDKTSITTIEHDAHTSLLYNA